MQVKVVIVDKDYLVDILQTMCGMSDEQFLAEFNRVETELEEQAVPKEDPRGYARLIEKLQAELKKN